MSSYLHLAKADLKYAHFGLTQGNDEVDINYAAYHVHQAIEKIAKGLLEFQGEDIARRRYRTHDIGFLLSCLPSEIDIPPIIIQRTFEIMRWVSEPRYNVNFRLSRDGVYEVYADTLHWLETIIPPVQGEVVQNPYVKSAADKNMVGKSFPKKKDTGTGSPHPGAYKRKKKKKKSKA